MIHLLTIFLSLSQAAELKPFCDDKHLETVMEAAKGFDSSDTDVEYGRTIRSALSVCQSKPPTDEFKVLATYKKGTLKEHTGNGLLGKKQYQSFDYFYGIYFRDQLVSKMECSLLVDSKCVIARKSCAKLNPAVYKATSYTGLFHNTPVLTCCVPGPINKGKVPSICDKPESKATGSAPSSEEPEKNGASAF